MKLPGITLFALGVSTSMHSSAGFVAPSVKSVGKNTQRQLFNFFGTASSSKYPVYAEETVMSQKAHGTSEKPVQKDLRWNCDFEVADRICNFNRVRSWFESSNNLQFSLTLSQHSSSFRCSTMLSTQDTGKLPISSRASRTRNSQSSSTTLSLVCCYSQHQLEELWRNSSRRAKVMVGPLSVTTKLTGITFAV